MRQIIAISVLFLACISAKAQIAEDLAVELSATVQTTPPKITLHWKNITFGAPGYRIYKKAKSANVWGPILDSVPPGTTHYDDFAVAADSAYEYQVIAPGTTFKSSGYIYAGIKAPPIHHRGILLLLVDDVFTDSCATELKTLMNDLRGDGWQVIRHDLSRTATDVAIKAVIKADYTAHADVRAVLIVGHLAVPYSGIMAPDGHVEHVGAWPADVFYASMDTAWTDVSINTTGANFPANHNVPGDGKWDQNFPPAPTQLQVSRIDFFDMPAFAATEVQLMRRYLAKDHAYKMDSLHVRHRALHYDYFGYFSGQGFGANGWRNFAPLVGRDSMTVVGYYYLIPFLSTESYQWVYGCGGGSFTGINAIGTTADFASKPNYSIFTMLFGSYFGDWNVQDNCLRAPLCSNPPALTSCWAGRPNWFFHHMALGENIGYSTKLVQNNKPVVYTTNVIYGDGATHVALMGDLSLRTDYIKPPSNLLLTANQNEATLQWAPSPDPGVIGYHVYRSDSEYGYFQKVTPTMLTTTAFQETVPTYSLKYYMVRPVKLQTSASGTYYNLGVGITDTITLSTPVSQVKGLLPALALSVSPNPAQDYLNVSIGSAISGQATVFMVNSLGQTIKMASHRLSTGGNSISIDISGLVPGIYTFVLKSGDRTEGIRWVKR